MRMDRLSRAQQKRVARLSSGNRVEVQEGEHTWQLWNAPQLSALIQSDGVSDDHEVFITKGQKREMMHWATMQEMEYTENSSYLQHIIPQSHIACTAHNTQSNTTTANNTHNTAHCVLCDLLCGLFGILL